MESDQSPSNWMLLFVGTILVMIGIGLFVWTEVVASPFTPIREAPGVVVPMLVSTSGLICIFVGLRRYVSTIG